MSIKNLPMNSRPREKALNLGIQTLTDLELLSLLIGSGSNKCDAIDVAKNMLKKAGSIHKLNNFGFSQLTKISGIGDVRALEFLAIFEICKRIKKSKDDESVKVLSTIQEAVDFAHPIIGENTREKFLVVIIDDRNRVSHSKIMYTGTRHNVASSPTEIIGYILRHEKPNFYCFHNHPSGNITPSKMDIEFTNQLEIMSRMFGLKLLGHVVICKNKSFEKIEI